MVLLTLAVLAPVSVARAREPRELTLTGTATARGQYLYLPFSVPAGVNRVAVEVSNSSAAPRRAALGAGLFDSRGVRFGSPGFRGIYGSELSSFFVAPGSASRAFVPGPIRPGRWHVVVPVYLVFEPTQVTARVTLSFGPSRRVYRRQPVPQMVRDRAGWYRGDLHAHTTFSSDAFASGSARPPGGLARLAQRSGLDFLSLTDHNVTAQNDRLAAASPRGFLLLGGEEVTTWFSGHSTVTGIESGDFFDWRFKPSALPLERGEGRVSGYLDLAERRDVYTSAAHPLIPVGGNGWDFFPDAARDARALPDGLEVWNGPFDGFDEQALAAWDGELRRGRRLWANGGSDIHGIENNEGNVIGGPTTVVYASALSRRAVVAALKAGRSYVTERPRGPALYLTATGPRGQGQMMGGTIWGPASATARLSVLVRRGRGAVLVVRRDGAVIATTPVTADLQTVTLRQAVGRGGAVRVELRAPPDPSAAAGSPGKMRALTNPILLRPGRGPRRITAATPPPPP